MSRLQVIKGGEVMGMGLADYVWLDDDGNIAFKKRSILIGKNAKGDPVPLVDRWSFEFCPCEEDEYGNACQCDGENSTNRILVPAFFLPDPTRPQPNYIVLCHVKDDQDQPVESNNRAKLLEAMEKRGQGSKLVWFGFAQGYALEDPEDYESDGRLQRAFLASERHIGACFDAGLLFHSAWNEPAAGSWRFKVGRRGFPQDIDPDPPSALVVADHLVVARYLMEKIGGGKGLLPEWGTLEPYVSTAQLREPGGDKTFQANAIKMDLEDLGETRFVPHPTQGGYQCIQVIRDEPGDPYKLALDILTAVWPLNPETEQESK